MNRLYQAQIIRLHKFLNSFDGLEQRPTTTLLVSNNANSVKPTIA